jgi:hypothetical protein
MPYGLRRPGSRPGGSHRQYRWCGSTSSCRATEDEVSDLLCRVGVQPSGDARVDVQRDADVGVTEPLLHDLDHRRSARGRLAGRREDCRRDYARAGTAGSGEEAAQEHDSTRQGLLAGTGPDRARFPCRYGDQKWYGDGTQIATDEGKLFLDSVLDMGSRRVVGFAMDEHHDAELARAALAMAVAVRGGKQAIAGVIMHTDSETVGASVPGVPDRTAMDRPGCWCRGLPELPDPHTDRWWCCLSSDLSVPWERPVRRYASPSG